jgi:NAD(P)-dependent dehydrogenase (short-subunit alcohol dehydrogenase family)
MLIDFSDRAIIVTGATRGIGKQIADDLLSKGATLLLTGTNPDQIYSLNEEAQRKGLKKTYFELDVLKNDSLEQFLDSIGKYQKIDGLVNNAGINRLNAIGNIIESDWDEMINVNLTAPFKIIKVISQKMISAGYGRIVNIASIFSVISKKKRAAYSATKFGLHGLTVGVSNDLARYNVLVNTLSPGFVKTDLTRKNLSAQEMTDLANTIPAGRLGEVEDISNFAQFLLSDYNKYLTGQNIIVDGGFTNV